MTLILGRFEPPFRLPAALSGVAVSQHPTGGRPLSHLCLGLPTALQMQFRVSAGPPQDHMSQQAWSAREETSALEVRVLSRPVSLMLSLAQW